VNVCEEISGKDIEYGVNLKRADSITPVNFKLSFKLEKNMHRI